MTLVVVDASAALAWMLPSQSTVAADGFLAARGEYEFVAPAIFEWEVRNALLVLDRRRQASLDAYDAALDFLDRLEVRIMPPFSTDDLRELAIFARGEGLSLFDAAYMSLSLEQACALASRDGDLLKTARGAGIDCIDLRGDQPL